VLLFVSKFLIVFREIVIEECQLFLLYEVVLFFCVVFCCEYSYNLPFNCFLMVISFSINLFLVSLLVLILFHFFILFILSSWLIF
jgi:hypothetical protein